MTQGKLSGRVALVTGANSGIGLVTARVLAEQGAKVFIAGRPSARTDQALAQLNAVSKEAVELLPLDLSDLDSVRACAQSFLSRGLPLHLLINNAGLAGARGKSKSGFELAFGVNHLGHFLLTQLLLERIKSSAPARIVNVASKAHYQVKRWNWDAVTRSTKTLAALPEYASSKLANVLFSNELARRLAGSGVTTYALHPGVVASDVWRKVPWPIAPLMKLGMISTEEGAKTTLHCALSDEAGAQTGLYYDRSKPVDPNPLAHDAELARELWARSEAWVSG